MTQSNWESILHKGIISPESNICFVAALDCLIEANLPESLYYEYLDIVDHQRRYGADKSRNEAILKQLILHARGVDDLRLLQMTYANSFRDFRAFIKEARDTGKLAFMWVSPVHIVGIKDQGQAWKMVGNALPTTDSLSLAELYRFLHTLPDGKGVYRPNLWILNK